MHNRFNTLSNFFDDRKYPQGNETSIQGSSILNIILEIFNKI